MTPEGYATITVGITTFGGLATLILQNYFTRKDASIKLDGIRDVAEQTHKAVNGHLTTLTNELAVTARKLADITGTSKDEVKAMVAEKNASDHAKEGLK